MKVLHKAVAVSFFCFFGFIAAAQTVLASNGDGALPTEVIASGTVRLPGFSSATSIVLPVLPRMAPDLALATYERRAALQNVELAAYSSEMLVRAELPASSQKGEFQLERRYLAPRTLEFKPVRYSGDGFVKTNIIARLLQSEVDHVQKSDPNLTAINATNYKISYKGLSQIEGREVHVYQLKPRKKRAGLFKGRIFLDSTGGSLVRAEGKIVKSPSFFVKNIEFVQDFADMGRFTFPVHLHTEATARIVGRTIVDIFNRDFQPVAGTSETASRIGAE